MKQRHCRRAVKRRVTYVLMHEQVFIACFGISHRLFRCGMCMMYRVICNITMPTFKVQGRRSEAAIFACERVMSLASGWVAPASRRKASSTVLLSPSEAAVGQLPQLCAYCQLIIHLDSSSPWLAANKEQHRTSPTSSFGSCSMGFKLPGCRHPQQCARERLPAQPASHHRPPYIVSTWNIFFPRPGKYASSYHSSPAYSAIDKSIVLWRVPIFRYQQPQRSYSHSTTKSLS